MLNKVKTLKGYKLNGRDGEIGKVREFYFDDQHWAIRYLVADTGNWLTDRQVLISPYALVAVDPEKQNIDIDLTRKQIEESPSLETDKPVSRQFEADFYGYYGWPTYWSGLYMWGANPNIMRDRDRRKPPAKGDKSWDPNLRSTRDVSKHHVQAKDGEIGHVNDFIVDDTTWAIRYFVIDTRNWWLDNLVLVSPQWIDRVSWSEAKVFVNLTREAIKQSPEYTEASLLTREYETRLHQHYDRRGYWIGDPSAMEQSAQGKTKEAQL